MKIVLAEKAGFCFGVKRAVETVINTQRKVNKKIYTLGPLIHNNDVVSRLEKRNIVAIELQQIDSLKCGDVIVIRSHGVSPQIIKLLNEKGFIIVDATCPYVSKIHEKVSKQYKLGYQIVIVGDKLHPEVVGINGCCEDTALISKDGSGLEGLKGKVCLVAQTTEKQENWKKVLSCIENQCEEFIAFNTICSATEVRQKSAQELSKDVDVMVVIGGRNSSNTTKLYEICKENCETIHVENSNEIPKEILNTDKIKNIGVTAGASTPDWIIKEAILKMEENKEFEMNEQLAFMEKNDTKIIEGQCIKGIVISVNEKEAFVNLGYKSDGLLPRSEVLKDESLKMSDVLNIGDEIEVKIVNRRNEDGNIVLSRLELEREESYRSVKDAFKNGIPLTVKVAEVVKGGIVAKYNRTNVFIPASHVDLFHVNELNQYIGKELEVLIIECSEDRKGVKIVGSRKDLLKVEKQKTEEIAWNALEKDAVVEGEVKRLTDFGAFIDLNGIDGLLHVSEMSYGRITKPSDLLQVGQKIKVAILDMNTENKKISLSMKKLIENPWNAVEDKYPVGSIVCVKVVRFVKFGAFVELEPGIDGLVHISQISHERINSASDVLQIGEKINAKVLEVNKDEKKMALSIKAAKEENEEVEAKIDSVE